MAETLTPPARSARSVSRLEASIIEAMYRSDRATRRPRTWLALPADTAWLSVEVGTPYVRQALSRMVAKGTMFKHGHGRYVLAPAGTSVIEQVLPTELLLDAELGPGGDYYLGFLSAMVSHMLVDESVWGVFAAVRPSRFVGGQRELAGRPLHLVRIYAERKWIGIEEVTVRGRMSYRRSTLERTLLDTVDRPDVCGGMEMIVRAWERASREDRIDEDLLADLALGMRGLAGYRAAYWLHRLGRESAADRIIEGLGGAARSGAAWLYPGGELGEGTGSDHIPPRDRRTGLRINVPEHFIRGWLSYGK